jgi:hypothetical protein
VLYLVYSEGFVPGALFRPPGHRFFLAAFVPGFCLVNLRPEAHRSGAVLVADR